MTDYAVIEAMLMYGGGFVRQLAKLYQHADVINQARIKTAFEREWAQYRELAEQAEQRRRENAGP